MTDHFDSHTARFLAAVAMQMPKVSGDVMQGWIDNPSSLHRALKDALCPRIFKVWRRIKLGTGLTTADEFRKAITDNKMRICKYASDILGQSKFTVATEPVEVDLVVMSVRDLGFKCKMPYDKICAKAQQFGLDRCSPEVGPQLRLQYFDLQFGERLTIAMEAIHNSYGHRCLFSVGHDEDLPWLRTNRGDDFHKWDLNNQFVFVLPRE